MARPQQSAGRLVGSSFTIKNILNLPEDPNEITEPIQHALGRDIAAPPTPQLFNVALPPSESRSNCSDCWPCRPWTVRFATQLYTRGLGVTGFARDLRLSLLDVDDTDNGLKLRRRWPAARKKKQHSLFLPHQVQKMEKEFDSRKYLTESRRAELAVELKLTEAQVKTWFQNRRTKWRKELRNENPPREVPDGRLRYSLKARKQT